MLTAIKANIPIAAKMAFACLSFGVLVKVFGYDPNSAAWGCVIGLVAALVGDLAESLVS